MRIPQSNCADFKWFSGDFIRLKNREWIPDGICSRFLDEFYLEGQKLCILSFRLKIFFCQSEYRSGQQEHTDQVRDGHQSVKGICDAP